MCDKVKIKFEETGYINSNVFNAWVKVVFIPDIIERRKKYNYSSPAVLIINGCPSHNTKVLYDSCNDKNNVYTSILIRRKLDDFDKIYPFWERHQVTEIIRKMHKKNDYDDSTKKYFYNSFKFNYSFW